MVLGSLEATASRGELRRPSLIGTEPSAFICERNHVEVQLVSCRTKPGQLDTSTPVPSNGGALALRLLTSSSSQTALNGTVCSAENSTFILSLGQHTIA